MCSLIAIAQIKINVLMFLTLVSKANFYIFRINDWSRTIAVYLLAKTLNLAVDHPLSLIVFLYRVKYQCTTLNQLKIID